jgi:anti-anti-sigma factor
MMEASVTRLDGGSLLAFTGELTIYHAPEVKHALLEALSAAPALDVSLAEVVEMDSAGLQLLWLARREGPMQGKPVRLVAHGDASREVFDTLGMTGLFGEVASMPTDRPRQGGPASGAEDAG